MLIPVKEWIQENRAHVGTPFKHQARCKGVGVDCIGSIVSSANILGQDTSNIPADYGEFPDPSILLNVLMNSNLVNFDNKREIIPGYIAVVILNSAPQHFGVISENGNWIHACRISGKVVEVPFNYKDKRIHSLWIPTFVDFSL